MFLNNIILIILFCVLCDGLNILIIVNFFLKSHYFMIEPVAKELVARGHNVTMIVNSKIPQSHDYRVISVAENNKTSGNDSEIISMDTLGGTRMDMLIRSVIHVPFSQAQCERLKSSELQEFIKENNTFDVTVAEVFNTNCYFGLPKKYGTPIVGMFYLSIIIRDGVLVIFFVARLSCVPSSADIFLWVELSPKLMYIKGY